MNNRFQDKWYTRNARLPSQIEIDDDQIEKAMAIPQFKIKDHVTYKNDSKALYKIISICGNSFYKIQKYRTQYSAFRLSFYPEKKVIIVSGTLLKKYPHQYKKHDSVKGY